MGKYFLPPQIEMSDSGPPPNANFYPKGKKESYQGNGSPENVVMGDIGDDYTDLLTGDEWKKLADPGMKSGWVSEAVSEGLILATGSSTPRSSAERWAEVINVKDYGAEVDRVTDDTAAIIEAASHLTDGKTLLIPGPALMRLPNARTTAQVGVLLDNLKDITIKGVIVNDEFGDDDTDVWKEISSMTAAGTTVTVTTAAAHGRTAGSTVLIYTDSDNAYNGDVVITTVPTPTSFTYTTKNAGFAGGTPTVSPATGVTKYALMDFNRYLFRFRGCKNVTIDLTFIGNEVPRALNHRLGYQICDFQQLAGEDNTINRIDLDIDGGCTNGVAAGSYRSATIGHLIGGKIKVHALHCGYPVSLWSRAGEGSDFDIYCEDVHRGAYFAGPKNMTVMCRVKNFDNSGIIFTGHYVSDSEHYGVESVWGRVEDLGTDEQASFGIENGRFLIGVNGDPGAGTPEYRDITMEFNLKTTDTIGKNINAVRFYHHATNPCIIDGVVFTGVIDRSEVTSLTGFYQNYEIFMRTAAGQPVRNLTFSNFRVWNSATTTNHQTFKRDLQIADNVGQFTYINSATTSFDGVLITNGAGGTVRDLDDATTLTVDGSVGAPAWSFISDPDTGVYLSNSALRFTFDGALAYTMFSTAFVPHTDLTHSLGSPSQRWLEIHTQSIIFTPTTIAYGTPTAITFLTTASRMRTVTLAGDVEFVTTNLAAGRELLIRIIADGSTRAFTFPIDWKWIGAKPTDIAANKVGLLRLISWGTNDSDILAQWTVEA